MMSGGFAAFVELDLLQADAIFSDNYFHLTSKREKTVRLKKAISVILIRLFPKYRTGMSLNSSSLSEL